MINVADIETKIANKTKPIGSLGVLESIAKQVAIIQNSLNPVLMRPTILIFAADHGLTAEPISLYPKDVTAKMVENFCLGGAAINVFSRQNQMVLKIVDAGVDAEFEYSDMLLNAKIAYGTLNCLYGPSMTSNQLEKSLDLGAVLVEREHFSGCNTIGFGEMGIGNTAIASLIMQKVTNLNLDDCVGAGTGLCLEKIAIKKDILAKVLERHKDVSQPLDILRTVGGFEIAMMVGAYLKAFELGMLILIDGFIASSALLIAHSMNPDILRNCIFCHESDEKGHKLILDFLKVKPILRLGMRLGEASGIAVAYPIILSAVNFMNQMASFSDANISPKSGA